MTDTPDGLDFGLFFFAAVGDAAADATDCCWQAPAAPTSSASPSSPLRSATSTASAEPSPTRRSPQPRWPR